MAAPGAFERLAIDFRNDFTDAEWDAIPRCHDAPDVFMLKGHYVEKRDGTTEFTISKEFATLEEAKVQEERCYKEWNGVRPGSVEISATKPWNSVMKDVWIGETLSNFYLKGGKLPSGETFDEIMGWDGSVWDARHDFIQWLFLTDEPSNFNADAPLFEPEMVRHYQKFKPNLLRAYQRWQEFAAERKIYESFNHNWLRTTRVLRSLVLFGLKDEAEKLLASLEHLKDTPSWEFWNDAVQRPLPSHS